MSEHIEQLRAAMEEAERVAYGAKLAFEGAVLAEHEVKAGDIIEMRYGESTKVAKVLSVRVRFVGQRPSFLYSVVMRLASGEWSTSDRECSGWNFVRKLPSAA